MRLLSKAVLAGLGVVALAGSAYAAEQAAHVMAVALPDGSVAHIRYFGDKKPQVAVVPVELQRTAVPVALVDPFGVDRLFAAMHAQADAMMRQAAAMAAAQQRQGAHPNLAAMQSLPAGGSVSYSFYSSSSGQGGCTQSVQMTSYGNGAKPQVVRQTSGDCSALERPLQKTAVPAAPAATKSDPKTI